MAIEMMHNQLLKSEEHLESLRQSIYAIAKTYAYQVMKVTEMAETLNEAALEAQRQPTDRHKGEGGVRGAEA